MSPSWMKTSTIAPLQYNNPSRSKGGDYVVEPLCFQLLLCAPCKHIPRRPVWYGREFDTLPV